MSTPIRVEFDVPAAMRDGTVLRANVFRPADDGVYPVALTRTPYGKDYMSAHPFLDAVRLARAGYIVVIQDVRGRFRSDGQWDALRHESLDGYDTVEWAAALPGSSGAVGMYGLSYLGFTQWMAATQTPPSLKAIVPALTWSDSRTGVTWRGGAFELGLHTHWWLSSLGINVLMRRLHGRPPAEQRAALLTLAHTLDTLRSEGYFTLPLADSPLRRLDLGLAMLDDILARPNAAPPTTDGALPEVYDHVQVPALNIGGWYDIFTQGTLENFNALRLQGATPEARQSRLIVGPWSHVNYSHVVGDLDFGFASGLSFMDLQLDPTALTQRWFDHWLKGIDHGVTHEPPVRLFIMGANVWRDEQEWPLARAQYTPYYLHADGLLAPEPPAAGEGPDHFTYDPADPTPTLGGALLMNALYGPGVKDQRPIESRSDVLVYTSAPLAADTEVTGPIIVKLWAATDGPDTDFVARLVDVHPDGFSQNLTDGIIRARYRAGDTPELLEPNRPYEFTIDLWSTANVFKAGHRIRLHIASASFPRWDRNPNTGAPFGLDATLRPARQTVLHDAAHPSHVLLPLIPSP